MQSNLPAGGLTYLDILHLWDHRQFFPFSARKDVAWGGGGLQQSKCLPVWEVAAAAAAAAARPTWSVTVAIDTTV